MYDFLEQCNFFLCMVLVFSQLQLGTTIILVWFGSIRIHIGGCTSKAGFTDRLIVSLLAHVTSTFSLPLTH
jgi:hypothetical protein